MARAWSRMDVGRSWQPRDDAVHEVVAAGTPRKDDNVPIRDVDAGLTLRSEV
jgi:hypothetical protein